VYRSNGSCLQIQEARLGARGAVIGVQDLKKVLAVLVGTVSLLLLLVGRGVLVGRVVVGIRVILRGNARVVDVALVLAPHPRAVVIEHLGVLIPHHHLRVRNSLELFEQTV
jgi:hypothetical protein